MHADAIEKIDNKENKLKEKISESAIELRDRIDKDQNETQILISRGRLEIEQVEHSLELQLDKVKIALQSNQVEAIFNAVVEAVENLQNLSFTTFPQQIQDFIPLKKLMPIIF